MGKKAQIRRASKQSEHHPGVHIMFPPRVVNATSTAPDPRQRWPKRESYEPKLPVEVERYEDLSH